MDTVFDDAKGFMANKGHRLRTLGANAGVIVFALSALLSGCYYRGRPPEYGRRGYDHRYDRHDRRY